jgi:sporulation protein YlmC with PRC-barrel domain
MSVHWSAILAAAAAMWFSMAGQLVAQERKAAQEDPARKGKVSTQVEVKAGAKEGAGIVHRASEIAGMSVRNEAGKEVGTVKDTVIDVKVGEVRYAALSYGGFLGLGDKLFAVPWDAFSHRHNVANNEHFLVLNVDESTLKNAPGFSKETWPNFADAKFSAGIDKYYDKYRASRRAEVTVDAKAKVDVQPAPESSRSGNTVHRASAITGMKVKNAAGTDLGSVNDLVIDMDSGRVRYAALSYGGFLGLGDKLFAVPWGAFDCRYNSSDKEFYLVLNIDEATLRKASGFDKDNWPNFADPKISDVIDKYYGRKPETSTKATP